MLEVRSVLVIYVLEKKQRTAAYLLKALKQNHDTPNVFN